MTWLIALLGVIVFLSSYNRWFPVLGIRCSPVPEQPLPQDTVVLDIRDYQDADRRPVQHAQTLPYPYLKRHISTVKAKQVFLVAPDKVSRNLSIRLLRKNGFKVTGFTVLQDEGREVPVKAHCG
ncbi:hypothetical protein ACE4RR_06470 [Alteribacillus sp. HJP-4]